MQSFVEPLMEPLARGYEELYQSQRKSNALVKSKKDEFFGLRDFYRLEMYLVLSFGNLLNFSFLWSVCIGLLIFLIRFTIYLFLELAW